MADSKNAEFSTTIGQDAVFKGQLQFEKGVRLLGKFEGEVETKGEFLIAEGAHMAGEIHAGNIRVDGDVKGNLSALSKVRLSSSGKLEGDIQATRLEVEEGAVLIGRCTVGPNGTPQGSAPSTRSSTQTSPQSSASTLGQTSKSKGTSQTAEPVKK